MLGQFIETKPTKSFVVDIETYDPHLKSSGASWAKKEGHILGIACKIDDNNSEYYPLKHPANNYDRDKVKNYFNELFIHCYSNDIPIIGHYLYYDLGWLSYEGHIDLYRCPPIQCTFITSLLADNLLPAYSLAALVKGFGIGAKAEIDMNRIATLPVSTVADYACNDVDITKKLRDYLLDKFKLDNSSLKRENNIIALLVLMKKIGIKLDMEKVESLLKEYKEMIEKGLQEIYKIDSKVKPWNSSSIEVLFRRLNLPILRTEHGNPSFTQDYLEEMGNTNLTIKTLAEVRKLDKLITFMKNFLVLQMDGIIHPDYNNGKSWNSGTVTGRLSSSNPNIQQIPARTEIGLNLRSIFVPHDKQEEWHRFDYSQQEPRLMVHYASLLELKGIDEWVKKYHKNPNEDFYQLVMDSMNIQDRFIAKTNTLALSYGMGVKKMAHMLNISEPEASRYKQDFFIGLPWTVQLTNYVSERVRNKRQIKLLGGRILKFQYEDSKAFNHLIQGSAAEQTKQAMLDIFRETGKVPLNQVHDELNYSLCGEEIDVSVDKMLISYMKDAFKLQIPVKVDHTYGRNWKEAYK